jgi:pimeloyl-ACP methyl ester carboxylesterase
LLIFAHGFVSPYDPPGIPQEHLYAGPLSLVDAITMQDTAFAASAYATNGLATLEGLADTVDVATIFASLAGDPSRTYLVGASQGGLIAVLGIERYPELFDAALSACGPIGDMALQARYFGDVRVLWDQLYPGIFTAVWRQDPGDPGWMDERDVQGWDGEYEASIIRALQADPERARRLAQLADVDYDPDHPHTLVDGLLAALWYNLIATNDGIAKFGGQPYDNVESVYRGTDSEDADPLNGSVARFRASPEALQSIRKDYTPSGRLARPLVTLHNTLDPVVPYEQAMLYTGRTAANGALGNLHRPIAIARAGHCTFTPAEIIAAMDLLVAMVEGREQEIRVNRPR